MTEQKAIEDERAAFESWASDGGLYPQAVERRGDQYKLAQTHSYWQAWQARAALATQPAAGEPAEDARSAFEEAWSQAMCNDEGVPGAKPLRSLVDPEQYRGVAVNGAWRWFQRGTKSAAPPAAAHGDEAVLDVLKTAYESGYQDGQDAPNAYSDEKVKHRIALSLLEEMMADAAMRAQGDGDKK